MFVSDLTKFKHTAYGLMEFYFRVKLNLRLFVATIECLLRMERSTFGTFHWMLKPYLNYCSHELYTIRNVHSISLIAGLEVERELYFYFYSIVHNRNFLHTQQIVFVMWFYKFFYCGFICRLFSNQCSSIKFNTTFFRLNCTGTGTETLQYPNF